MNLEKEREPNPDNQNDNHAEQSGIGQRDAEQKSVDEQWAEELKIPMPENPIPPAPPTGQTPPPAPQPQTPPQYSTPVPPVAPRTPFAGYADRQPFSGNEQEPPMPPTYLIWSILCCVCCCLIPGIVAAFYSSKVSGRYYNGDYEGAEKASRMAQIWIIVSFVLGLVSASLYVPLSLISPQ